MERQQQSRQHRGQQHGAYCWEAKVDNKPDANTFANYNPNYNPNRNSEAKTIAGEGYVIDNAPGLLTKHVHMNDNENSEERPVALFVKTCIIHGQRHDKNFIDLQT